MRIRSHKSSSAFAAFFFPSLLPLVVAAGCSSGPSGGGFVGSNTGDTTSGSSGNSGGATGTSGSGTTGSTGTSGAGTTGSAGTSGAGTTGSTGTSGAGTTGAGTTGTSGAGTSGTSGAGTSGTSGTSGTGTTGTSGSSTVSDTWLTTPTAANSTGNYPFPQDRKLSRCTYPTTISHAVISARYMTWKAKMITSSGAPSGAVRVIDPNGTPMNRTVSEGIGYGMLIAVYFADKATFDGLWAYASAHMSNGLMSWNIDDTGSPYNGDTHSATDADEDMAWALLMADKQWGGTYLSTAKTLLSAIKSNEVSGSTLMGGDFTGGPTYYDYAAPAYYPAFATASGDSSWTQVVSGELTQLIGAQNGTTGLTPDSNGSNVFGYDAVRSPWRIGFDYCLHGTTQSQTYLSKVVPFLVNYANSNGGPSSLKLTIPLSGSPMGSDTSGTINGPAAIGAMMASTNQSFIDASYTYLAGTIVPETSTQSAIGPNYFSSTLGMIGLLTLSGNFVDYTSL